MARDEFDRGTDRLRTRRDRIERLRQRVKQAAAANRDDPIPGILAGMLDLLEDEL